MAKITLEQIKKLRKATRAGIMDCQKALKESAGNQEKAIAYLKKKGLAKAKKRADREVKSGVLETYTHNQGEIVAVVELLCETDFVARNKEFRDLAHEIAMQVAAMEFKTLDDLLAQSYIRDEGLTVKDLVDEAISKTGENIVLSRAFRFRLGKGK